MFFLVFLGFLGINFLFIVFFFRNNVKIEHNQKIFAISNFFYEFLKKYIFAILHSKIIMAIKY